MKTCEFITFPLFGGTFLSFDLGETRFLGLLLGRFLGVTDFLRQHGDVRHPRRHEVIAVGVESGQVETSRQFSVRNRMAGFILPSVVLGVTATRGVDLVGGVDFQDDRGLLQRVLVFLVAPRDTRSLPGMFGDDVGDRLSNGFNALLEDVREPQTGDGVGDLRVHDGLLC